MVRTNYKEHWDIPGGMVEIGETPSEAAARECKEELGILVEPGRLLVCETVLLKGGRLLNAYIFQKDSQEYDIQVDGEEVLEYAWLERKERYKNTVTAPIFRNRLEKAIQAFIKNETYY
jgi:8-oxo-dGTP pyrophosphatase MutT (NUDIX family)